MPSSSARSLSLCVCVREREAPRKLASTQIRRSPGCAGRLALWTTTASAAAADTRPADDDSRWNRYYARWHRSDLRQPASFFFFGPVAPNFLSSAAADSFRRRPIKLLYIPQARDEEIFSLSIFVLAPSTSYDVMNEMD